MIRFLWLLNPEEEMHALCLTACNEKRPDLIDPAVLD
jgi:hypothetical protein